MAKEHQVPGPILRATTVRERADQDDARRPDAATERHAPGTAYGGSADPAVPGSAPMARPGGHPHGRTRSWLLVVAIIAAFAVGGVAVVAALWWLFWVAAGLVALGILAARLIGVMDDTVEWDVPLDRSYQPQGHVIIGPTPPHVPRRREKR